MPAQVTNYKCPSCSGPLRFDSATGKLQCDYCGSSFEPADMDAYYAEKERKAAEAFADARAEENAQQAQVPEQVAGAQPAQAGGQDQGQPSASAEGTAQVWDTSELTSDWGAEGEQMRIYNCASCGAELICDATTAATSCPYCDNPTIVPGQFAGILKPHYVIPFKFDKDAAKQALVDFYKGKHFLPKKFKLENVIEELKGIYVPFWLFSGKTDADVLFDATITRMYSDGKYDVTEISHYNVRRAGTLLFDKIPADASSKMPDDLMDSIEPYDYNELKEFSTAYLPGFLADKYDVSAEDNRERADLRCRNSAVNALQNTVTGYGSCTVVSQTVTVHGGTVKYALLPVWFMTTRWNHKQYIFAMNGQTGKFVGDLPISRPKFWSTFAVITLAIMFILLILLSM